VTALNPPEQKHTDKLPQILFRYKTKEDWEGDYNTGNFVPKYMWRSLQLDTYDYRDRLPFGNFKALSHNLHIHLSCTCILSTEKW